MDVYQKIKNVRTDLGLKQSEMAEILGIHQRDVSKLENGNKKYIPKEYMEFLVSRGYDVNTLFNDKIPLQKFNEEITMVKEPKLKLNLRTDKLQENQIIPLYNLEASAGLVELFEHYNEKTPLDYISIPNLPKSDGAVFVTGDSMYPLLKSGDIVIYKMIHNIDEGLFWGEMYLISITVDDEEYVSVKYIQKSEKGENFIKLVSQNSHHQPRDVEKSRIRALAMVKASVRINAMR
jgi:transcriptional regulator with XRE-family HTH domain